MEEIDTKHVYTRCVGTGSWVGVRSKVDLPKEIKTELSPISFDPSWIEMPLRAIFLGNISVPV